MAGPWEQYAQSDAGGPWAKYQSSAEPRGESWTDAVKNVGSAAVRPIAKGIAGIPLMAADAGVGLVNGVKQLIAEKRGPTLRDFNPFAMSGGDYPLPSQTFDQSLDTVTRAPEGIAGKASEFVSSAIAGARVPSPIGVRAPPSNFVAPKQALKDAALRAAQREGYVVPPSSNNPTVANRLMEGIAGKQKLTQEAMMRNQPVTEALAARALGQNPEVPLTKEALAAIRSEAAQAGYEPIRNAGQITASSDFAADLAKLIKSGEGATRMGIKTENPAQEVIKTLSQKKSFDAADAVDSIAYIRGLADDAYSSGQKTVGAAYKGAAKAIEDEIERNLASRGKDGAELLKGFRDARRLMAQTYTAGKALTDEAGTVNALKYASELRKGKPLTGDQRTIGQFASQFGKFAATPKEIYPSISPLDMYGSAITAGLTESAAPLALPLTRVGLREYLLSQAGQARAVPEAFRPQSTLGLLGAYPQANLLAGQ